MWGNSYDLLNLHRLFLHQCAKLFGRITPRKFGERFLAARACRQISPQQRLDHPPNVLRWNVANDLPADLLAASESSADKQVISLDHLRSDFCPQKSHVAN